MVEPTRWYTGRSPCITFASFVYVPNLLTCTAFATASGLLTVTLSTHASAHPPDGTPTTSTLLRPHRLCAGETNALSNGLKAHKPASANVRKVRVRKGVQIHAHTCESD